MFKELIDKHFPFETYNPGQREAIEFALNSLIAGKRHVIIEAPTGIGKSVIATTVHRALAEYKLVRFRTTIITGTKGLQDQYVDSDDKIYDLKGKTNYKCPFDVGPYASPSCREFVLNQGCKKNEVCPYVMRRNRWCNDANLRLTNASFQIEACPSLVMAPENRADMIIVDECHDLPKHLVTHCTVSIDADNFHYTKKLNGFIFFSKMREAINSVRVPVGKPFVPTKTHIEAFTQFGSYVTRLIDAYSIEMSSSKNKETIGGAIEELQSISDKIDMFVNIGTDGEWIVMNKKENYQVELKPVYASQVAEFGLFRKAPQFIHMSATICGIEEYAKSLGITDYASYCIDNPIPLDNRRVVVDPLVNVSGDFDMMRLSKVIDRIIAKQGNSNGVIHSVSFKLANEIKDFSRFGDRMVISNNRTEILELLRKKDSGVIIVSPSIEHGYDFKGDMCRWQIIAKVPFHYLGDPFIRLNMERSSKWYAREAILRLVQASGRAVRGVDDYATTYITDGNFKRLLRNNRDLFPQWYLDAIHFD